MKLPVIVAAFALLTVPTAAADDVLNCWAVIWSEPELQEQWDTTCGDVNTISNLDTLDPFWTIYNNAMDAAMDWADWTTDTAMIPVNFAWCMAVQGPPCTFEQPDDPPVSPENDEP